MNPPEEGPEEEGDVGYGTVACAGKDETGELAKEGGREMGGEEGGRGSGEWG